MTTHRERIQACIQGGLIDRPPVALWRHFPVDDQTSSGLAAATLRFQSDFDFDLVKVTPASSFCLKDWGADDAWRGNPEGTRDYILHPVRDFRDWESLPVLTPQAPHLDAQLACLREIRASLPAETPILQTVFSPLAQAKNLVGGERLLAHLRLHPQSVLQGLKTIAETTRRFVEAALQTGIDGVFYAIQHAQSRLMSWNEYQTFGLPFDRLVLEPSEAAWCNMLHLHGRDVHFQPASHLPVQIVNWHDRETSPSLPEARGLFRGGLCGGIRQDTLVFKTAAEVSAEALDALHSMDRRGLLLSTGCVVPVIAPQGNLLAARQVVESSQ